MTHSRIAAEAEKLAAEFDRIALERPGKSVVGGWHFACGESPESCRDCDLIPSTQDQARLLLEVLYGDPEANEDAAFDGWFVHELINPFAHRSTPEKQFALISYAFNFTSVFSPIEDHRIGRPIWESALPVMSLACRGNQLRQMCESVPDFLEITNLSLALTGADQEPRNKAYRFEMFEWACFVVLICERYLSLPHYGRYALTLEDESGTTPIDDQNLFETPVSLVAEGTDSHWDISRLAGFLELSGSVCRWMAFQLENGTRFQFDGVLELAGVAGARVTNRHPRRRKCFKRDHTWLKWSEENLKPAKIRDRWNKENPDEKINTLGSENGRDTVKKGIKAAKADRDAGLISNPDTLATRNPIQSELK